MIHPALRKARILDTLAEGEIEGLVKLGDERAFAATEAVFREHEPVDSLFIVLDGRISTVLRENGQLLELAKYGPGDHFGRAAIIGGQLCYTSAIALTAGRIFVLSSTGAAALLGRIARASALPTDRERPSERERAAAEPQILEVEPPGLSSSEADFVKIRAISGAVAGVAHEINTPLGVIQSAASFVTEQLSPAVVRSLARDSESADLLTDVLEACQLIQKNVAHASKLVQSFKKLSVGQLAEPRQQVDLVRIIHEVLNVFRSKALSALPPAPNWKASRGQSGQHRLFLASSRLDIAVKCTLGEPDRAWNGFPGLFSRVLLNLLTNIDRYAYPGDREGRVEIEVTRCESRPGAPGFEISVRDFGKGILSADLPRIFEPFFTTGRGKGGTGLGLAMVNNLVTQGFDGSIRVESEIGRGTTFYLRFPETAPEHGPSPIPS